VADDAAHDGDAAGESRMRDDPGLRRVVRVNGCRVHGRRFGRVCGRRHVGLGHGPGSWFQILREVEAEGEDGDGDGYGEEGWDGDEE
jgi:hypothetical protein